MNKMKLACNAIKSLIFFILLLQQSYCFSDNNINIPPSQKYFDEIKQFVNSGQFNLAKEKAKELATYKDADPQILSEVCGFLSDNKNHDGAIILLRRLDWRLPAECHWWHDTVDFMLKKGMDREVDLVLTYGTALTNDNRERAQYYYGGTFRSEVRPLAAEYLFNFWDRVDKEKCNTIFSRYEQELKKRPNDLRLITEYAYWLINYGYIDQAVMIIKRIDPKRYDILTLLALGYLCNHGNNIQLVPSAISILEVALNKEITNEDVYRYTSEWQMSVSADEGKRLIYDKIILGLADNYCKAKRYEDARVLYEKYLAMPRRERWGDRTQVESEYAKVLSILGEPDKIESEMEKKALQSNGGKDWAELAAYLQGCGKIEQAKKTWRKAIEATPPVPRGFKVDDPREQYQKQLIKMLGDNKFYEEEIVVLKELLSEETDDYVRMDLFKKIASVYMKSGKKDEAVNFLERQLDEKFNIEIVFLIIRVDYGKDISCYTSLTAAEVNKLPMWGLMLDRINKLPETEKFEALKHFYGNYDMYTEYINLVEQFPDRITNWGTMATLMDFSHRCGRYDRTVYWGKKMLEHINQPEFPVEGDREYIEILEGICEYAAKGGDFNTSLEYAKKLCLIVPSRFDFVIPLAELAAKENKKEKLINELTLLAKEHPNSWVPWQTLSEIYGVWNNERERDLCLNKVKKLR